jgi:hypothetical protein
MPRSFGQLPQIPSMLGCIEGKGKLHNWNSWFLIPSSLADDSAGQPNRTAKGCPKGEAHGCAE